MKHWLIACIVLFSGTGILAQDAQQERVIGQYSTEKYYGINLRTTGWGGSFQYGKHKGVKDVRLFTMDFNFVHHEKEIKSFFQDPSARGFYYGKLNAFYTLKFGFGHRKMIYDKLRRNGVEISSNWSAGPVLGFMRPIYLQILVVDPNLNGYTIDVQRYDPTQHYMENIYGRASNLLGIGQMKVMPGFGGKYALMFEYSKYKTIQRGLEIGVAAEAFPRKIEILSNYVIGLTNGAARNHWLFVSGYVNFYFGRQTLRK
jgi:hypothetical protein